MLGWLLGRGLSDRFCAPDDLVLQAAVRGLALGVTVAFGLGLLDALWNLGWRNILQVLGRLAVAIVLGGLGGLAGGGLAMLLVVWTQQHETYFFVAGWTLVGLMLGASISALEFVRGRSTRRPRDHRQVRQVHGRRHPRRPDRRDVYLLVRDAWHRG